MSKTALAIGEIAAGVALIVVTAGAAAPAVAWGLSASMTAGLFAIGVSAGLSGVFGLLQPLLNPQDTSVPGSQTNAQESAAFRRVIYGVMEVGGVLTFDSAPAGNADFQNQGPTKNWRHMVFTVSATQITSFGRHGIPMVVIDGIPTQLFLDPDSGYYIPKDSTNPYGGNDGAHIGFEFDLGSPASTSAFPLLSAACPDWKFGKCVQRGRAKVHVAMKYDCTADGSQVGNEGATYTPNLQTSVPIYVSGRIPSLRFPLVGKPLVDTRAPSGGGGGITNPAWQPSSPFGYAQYVIDASNNVQVQMNGPGGIFVSAATIPAWAPVGGVIRDGSCLWLNAGQIHAGAWPGPGSLISCPYVFRDPNGNLQLNNTATGVGSVVITNPGDCAEKVTASDGGGGFGVGAKFHVVMDTHGLPPEQIFTLHSISVSPRGLGYPGNVNLVFSDDGEGSEFAHGVPLSRVITTGSAEPTWSIIPGASSPDNTGSWLCLGTPSGYAFATNPSNPALIIFDYLTNTEFGEGADPATIDIDSINAAANICEEVLTVQVASSGSLNLTVVVPGTTQPWKFGGGLNSGHTFGPFGNPQGTDPISIPAVPGTPLNLSWVSGLASVFASGSLFDANGNPGIPNPGGNSPIGSFFSGALCGGWADGTGQLIGNPFGIGDTWSGIAPAGATQLLIGMNDGGTMTDNAGAWTILATGGAGSHIITENRYSCDGVFDYGAARGDVLKSLLSSMAGTIVPPGDQWHVFAGAYAPPTAALTDADLRDSIKGDFRISRRDICNGVKGTFIPSFLPTNTTEAQPLAWRWTDFPPYQGNGLNGSPNYIAEDGGQIIWKEARFGFTTSIWMVQRLAKIVLQLLRFQVTLHLSCKLSAFPIQAGDTITFTHARWAALDNPPPTTFFVTQATLIIDNRDGVPALGVDLILRQTDPSVYDFGVPVSPTDQGEYSQYGTLGVL